MMYKVTWNEKTHRFKHCFAVGNYESMVSLAWNLTHRGENDGCDAIDVKIWDLSGNEITDWSQMKTQGEWTYAR